MKKQRLSYAFFVLAALAFFLYYPGYISHFLLILTFVLPLVSLLTVLPVHSGLVFSLSFEKPSAARNEENVCILTVHNPSCFPCACIRVWVTCENKLETEAKPQKLLLEMSAAPFETAGLRTEGSFSHCGKILLSLTRARVCDPLGLFALPVKQNSPSVLTADTLILPRVTALELLLAPSGTLNQEDDRFVHHRAGQDPSGIFQLREYQAGDRLQRIHWKLSHRLDTLIVKDFNLPDDFFVQLLADFGEDTPIDAIDSLMDAAASFSAALLEQQIPCALTWAEDSLLKTEPLTGADALTAALHSLLSRPLSQNGVPGEALDLFSRQSAERYGGHLLYLAGADASETADVPGLLAALALQKHYASVTVLTAGQPPSLTAKLEAAGCRVYTFDTDAPGAERSLWI